METYFNSTPTESATENVEVAWEHELRAAPFRHYTAKIFQRRYTTEPKFTAFIEIDGERSRFDGPVIFAETTVEGGKPGGFDIPSRTFQVCKSLAIKQSVSSNSEEATLSMVWNCMRKVTSLASVAADTSLKSDVSTLTPMSLVEEKRGC